MDKSQIPTIESITIGEGEGAKVVKLYKWLTQKEEDEYQSILLGESELGSTSIQSGQKGETPEIEVHIKMRTINDAKQYLTGCYLANISFDEYSVLEPSIRADIDKDIEKLNNKKK